MYSWTCTKQHCLAAEVTNSLELLPFWRSFSLCRQNIKRDIRNVPYCRWQVFLAITFMPKEIVNSPLNCQNKKRKKGKGWGGGGAKVLELSFLFFPVFFKNSAGGSYL
jgi:hypothetical protein